ncbi:hypothetical protein, partial [Klebsiella pneumoniae]|uniref:hypothetical protein n=1 Tax=Klebsiella pneumoniae TaxID=573 RepID=UPI0027305960
LFFGRYPLLPKAAEPANPAFGENLIYHIDFKNYFINILDVRLSERKICPGRTGGKQNRH